MKKIIYLLSFVAILSIASCKQDKCNGVVCQNGGTCNEGKCQCNSAFTGDRCETHTNGCDTIRCYNGGNCTSGQCNCPAHTSGDSCTILQTPTKMYITGVTVNHFCPTDQSGHTWDWDGNGSPADIYPVIKRNGVVIYNGHDGTHNMLYNFVADANYDTQHQFFFHEDSIGISDVTNPNYRFELWDYDDSINDDFMDGFDFTPFTGLYGFPGSFSYHDTTAYHKQFDFRINYYQDHNNYEW